MKKILAVSMVMLAAMATVTGCASINLGDGASIVGDSPRPGQTIEVIETVSYETAGPAEMLVIWRPYNEGFLGVKTFRMIGCHPSHLRANGIYLVEKDVETGIDFLRVTPTGL